MSQESLLMIDGSHGEGGGQIVRASVSLATITGRAVEIERIRAGRPKPGLARQHLSAVHAAAEVCDARLAGDILRSSTLTFFPQRGIEAGDYVFDVSKEAKGGSAAAATLVLQTVMVPLALAPGRSTVTVHGGTHVAWSPSFDYLSEIWVPMLERLGVHAEVRLIASGWYPAGQGTIESRVEGLGASWRETLRPLRLEERGTLRTVCGRALAARLPSHIPERMAARATALLSAEGITPSIEIEVVDAVSPGAAIFLAAEYECVRCGFSAVGERGKRSEVVAEEAVEAFVAHQRSSAALDVHLADQILTVLALANGPSFFTVERASRHLETLAWLIGEFGLADVSIATDGLGRTAVQVVPRDHAVRGPWLPAP